MREFRSAQDSRRRAFFSSGHFRPAPHVIARLRHDAAMAGARCASRVPTSSRRRDELSPTTRVVLLMMRRHSFRHCWRRRLLLLFIDGGSPAERARRYRCTAQCHIHCYAYLIHAISLLCHYRKNGKRTAISMFHARDGPYPRQRKPIILLNFDRHYLCRQH